MDMAVTMTMTGLTQLITHVHLALNKRRERNCGAILSDLLPLLYRGATVRGNLAALAHEL